MPLSSTHGSTPRASHNTRALLAVPSLRLESLFGRCRTERAPSSPASVQLYHSQFCEAIFESYREQHEFTTLFLSHVDARTKSTLSHRHASGCRNALITIQAQPPGRRSRLIAGVHSNGIGRRLLSLKRGWQAVHPSCVLSLASHVFWSYKHMRSLLRDLPRRPSLSARDHSPMDSVVQSGLVARRLQATMWVKAACGCSGDHDQPSAQGYGIEVNQTVKEGNGIQKTTRRLARPSGGALCNKECTGCLGSVLIRPAR
jgi:hypothetical protein